MAGFLSGLLGMGGGFVIVPALRGFTNLDIKSIVATSLAVIAMVSAGGVIVAAWHGLIIWGHAWPFATGAVVGMLAGRVLARGLTGPRVQQSFAVFALFVAVGLLINLVYKEEQSHGSQICPAWRAISGSNQLPLWASLCLLVDSDCQSTIAVRTLYQWVLTATD